MMKQEDMNMADQNKTTQDAEFEQMIAQRIRERFTEPVQAGATAGNDRLREMNKKLPSWSLEPPYSFLK